MKLRLATIALTAAMAFKSFAQGYIVPNGVFVESPPEISVVHNPAAAPAGGSYTGFLLMPQSPNTFQFSPVVDVGVRVFFASPGDPVSLEPILAQTYTELVGGSSYLFDEGTPFYVGLYTGNVQTPPPNGIYNDPLFGWAELQNVGGTIQLVNSALEYQGGGIYVGTQTIIPIVPEPNAFALLGLGSLFLVRHGKGSSLYFARLLSTALVVEGRVRPCRGSCASNIPVPCITS